MLLTQLCLPHLRRASDGVVVNIASSAGIGLSAYASPEYAAAKAGLIRFTTSVADRAPRHGVRVNCLVPDWIGLPRARRERDELSAADRAGLDPLIPPDDVVTEALSMIEDPGCAGQVRRLRGGHPPQRLDR